MLKEGNIKSKFVLVLTFIFSISQNIFSDGLMKYRFYNDSPNTNRYMHVGYNNIGKESQYLGSSYRDETFRLIYSKDISDIPLGAKVKSAVLTIQFLLQGNNTGASARIVEFPSGIWPSPNRTAIQDWEYTNTSQVFRDGISTGNSNLQQITFVCTNTSDLNFINSIESSLGNKRFNFCIRLSSSSEDINFTRANVLSINLDVQ